MDDQPRRYVKLHRPICETKTQSEALCARGAGVNLPSEGSAAAWARPQSFMMCRDSPTTSGDPCTDWVIPPWMHQCSPPGGREPASTPPPLTTPAPFPSPIPRRCTGNESVTVGQSGTGSYSTFSIFENRTDLRVSNPDFCTLSPREKNTNLFVHCLFQRMIRFHWLFF